MKVLRKLGLNSGRAQGGSGLTLPAIILLIVIALAAIVLVVSISQYMVELNALTPLSGVDPSALKEQREIDKLAAEIRQIRSDTAGSLFWLRMIGVFVTVGGAVGGYLLGQSQSTRKRLDFEQTKNVEEVYQSIIQKLSDPSPLLRASAVVKLGTILREFPAEWRISSERLSQRIEQQLVQHTQDVLATSLAIEENAKVLKTITINLVKHPLKSDPPGAPPRKDKPGEPYNDARELDLSNARAADAYWAWTDFSASDFFRAELSGASFRGSILKYAQFREACLRNAVFRNAICEGTNFYRADLRGANFSGATLKSVNLEGAWLAGANFSGAILENLPLDAQVNVSAKEGEVANSRLGDWLGAQGIITQ
jgi:hypothetical protein